MQFVIIHGSYGSKDKNWFPWLDSQLSHIDQQVFRPQMPVDEYQAVQDAVSKGEIYSNPKQSKASWLEQFEKVVMPHLNGQPLVCVGHSLGATFILNVLSSFDLKLDTAIFVSPFLSDLQNPVFDTVNHDFYKDGFDFEKLRANIDRSYVLFSDNDPYVPSDHASAFATELGSSLIEIHNGDHLGGVLKEFPLVLELCRTRI